MKGMVAIALLLVSAVLAASQSQDIDPAEILNQRDLLKNYTQSAQSVTLEEARDYTLNFKPVPAQTGQ